MKEELYRSMYRQIHLSDRQKNRIRAGIRDAENASRAERKTHLTLRGALCVCVAAVASCFTVLAANPSYVDRIAAALHFYGGREGEPTPLENELYAAYGTQIAYTLDTAAGKVELEAVFYDDGYAFIPFTLYPNTALTPGTDLQQDLETKQQLFDILREMRMDAQGGSYYFRVKGHRREDIACSTQINPAVQEDGTLTGSYLIHCVWRDGESGIAQGDVIQWVKEIRLTDGEPWGRLLEEGESTEGLNICIVEINGIAVEMVDLSPEDEVIAEIELESGRLPKREIATGDIPIPYGMKTEKITLTPLALYLSGTGDANQPGYARLLANMSVVLKDGTVIGGSASGTLTRGGRDENDEYAFSISMLLDETVDLDEVAGVRITEQGEEICFIPLE